MTPWMLRYAAYLHLGWGILLVITPDGLGATPLASLHRLIGIPFMEACVYWGASLATLAMLTQRVPGVWSLVLGLPQQCLLFVSAGGACSAVLLQHYADGVPRPWAFIFADQLPTILAAVCHTMALIEFHGGSLWRTR